MFFLTVKRIVPLTIPSPNLETILTKEVKDFYNENSKPWEDTERWRDLPHPQTSTISIIEHGHFSKSNLQTHCISHEISNSIFQRTQKKNPKIRLKTHEIPIRQRKRVMPELSPHHRTAVIRTAWRWPPNRDADHGESRAPRNEPEYPHTHISFPAEGPITYGSEDKLLGKREFPLQTLGTRPTPLMLRKSQLKMDLRSWI